MNAPSLTLRLEESENVVLSDGALDVPDDRTGRVVHELDANLGDTTAGTSAAENLDNLGELDRDLVRSRLLLETQGERRRGRESANPELMERRAQAVSRFDLAVSTLLLASFPLCDSLDNAAWTPATASIETARESREVAR